MLLENPLEVRPLDRAVFSSDDDFFAAENDLGKVDEPLESFVKPGPDEDE